MFKSRAGQIGNGVANGLPPLAYQTVLTREPGKNWPFLHQRSGSWHPITTHVATADRWLTQWSVTYAGF